MSSNLLETLRQNRVMRTDSEVVAFESALEKIAAHPDPALLSDLHLIFDDSCAHEDVMFGLVHFLESFPLESQLRAFASVLPQLSQRAPWWTKTLHFRILNDASARTCYGQVLSAVGGVQKSAACAVLEAIVREENDPLKSSALAVLAAACSA